MDPFHLPETKRELIFNVNSCVCIMRQLFMVVEFQFFRRQANRFMELHPGLFPALIPSHFGARADEKLHFHLFKFPHTERELTRNDLISKSFSYLRNPERNLHPSAFLHIKEIDK